jgi:hypothetical protein
MTMKLFTQIALLALLGCGALGQSQPMQPSMIDIKLAQFVASQQVQRNNPPFEWRSVDHIVLHGTEGDVRGYAFVFAKAEIKLRSPADLQRHIQEKSDRLHEAQEEAAKAKPGAQAVGETPTAVVEAEENLYNFNDLATVITGATSDSSLILRHFRGLPEFWVEAETLDSPASARLYGKSLQVSRVIMITPMDFRLAASEGAERALTKADLRSAQKATIPDSSQVLKIHGRRLEKMSSVRKARQDVEARKQQRLSTLKPADQQKYEQALQDRAKALAGEWDQHRAVWKKAGSK